jgi:hypothetical protein
MTKTISAIVAGILALSGGTAVAQTRADMAKITCGELSEGYADELTVVIAWMSGYYNAKRNNTIIDAKQLKANTQKVMGFCKTKPKMTVMKAIQQLSKAKN